MPFYEGSASFTQNSKNAVNFELGHIVFPLLLNPVSLLQLTNNSSIIKFYLLTHLYIRSFQQNYLLNYE